MLLVIVTVAPGITRPGRRVALTMRLPVCTCAAAIAAKKDLRQREGKNPPHAEPP